MELRIIGSKQDVDYLVLLLKANYCTVTVSLSYECRDSKNRRYYLWVLR